MSKTLMLLFILTFVMIPSVSGQFDEELLEDPFEPTPTSVEQNYILEMHEVIASPVAALKATTHPGLSDDELIQFQNNGFVIRHAESVLDDSITMSVDRTSLPVDLSTVSVNIETAVSIATSGEAGYHLFMLQQTPFETASGQEIPPAGWAYTLDGESYRPLIVGTAIPAIHEPALLKRQTNKLSFRIQKADQMEQGNYRTTVHMMVLPER